MFDLLINIYKLRKNLRINLHELEELQNKKLRAIVKYSYNNVPYYHKRFNEINLKPSDIKNIEDLKKIPFLTKSKIQENKNHELISRNIDLRKCRKTKTSGSTGLPLTVYTNKQSALIDDALWLRAHFERGMNIRDKMAVLRDPRYFSRIQTQKLLETLGIIRRKYISIFNCTKTQIYKLIQFDPDIIRSYPSSLIILTLHSNEYLNFIHPKMLFTSGEFIDSNTRKTIQNIFHGKIFDNYSSNELSLIAWECKIHDGYHINADDLILETIKNSEVVSPSERGEIIITKLNYYAMPLIRYRIGDVGILNEEKCTCGVNLPLLKIIEGRVDDFLITMDGEIISPIIFFPYPFKETEQIKNFKIIQEKKDKIVIQILFKENGNFNANFFDYAEKEIKNVFGKDMRVYFEIMDEIKMDASGKIRKVISKITNHI